MQNLTNPQAEAIFADQDLTFTQWICLMGLREGVAETNADLARHLNHDAGAVTRVVDELEKRGLLRRERSKADRRVVKLTLTPQGRAVARMHVPPIVDFWNRVTDEFTHQEIKQLLDLMARLIARLEAEPVREPAAKEKVKKKKRVAK
ncbi:MAG: MarR family winged helix-turn-helix transcriptional regulator [Rhizomicrobium sp.]